MGLVSVAFQVVGSGLKHCHDGSNHLVFRYQLLTILSCIRVSEFVRRVPLISHPSCFDYCLAILIQQEFILVQQVRLESKQLPIPKSSEQLVASQAILILYLQVIS